VGSGWRRCKHVRRRERRAAEHAKKKIGDYVANKHKIDRVKELARAIGADEDGAAFQENLVRIARQMPKDEPKKSKR